MAGNIQCYRWNQQRLRRGCREGFTLTVDGKLVTDDSNGRNHYFFSRALDSGSADFTWGRCRLYATLAEEMLLTVYAAATDATDTFYQGKMVGIDAFLTDPSVPSEEKKAFFTAANGIQRSGVSDLLLHSLSGQYLYLALEVEGGGKAVVEELSVLVPGDHFYHTFPEVYDTEDDFFRRWISIFSTLYHEGEETIEQLPSWLDPRTAPEQALYYFADWLGLDLRGLSLSTEQLRELVLHAPILLAQKGTRASIEWMVGLLVKAPFYLVEQNLLPPEQAAMGQYGDSPYDITLLIQDTAKETLSGALQAALRMVVPMRCRCRILFTGNRSALDDYTYLDLNGKATKETPGMLEAESRLAGASYLL